MENEDQFVEGRFVISSSGNGSSRENVTQQRVMVGRRWGRRGDLRRLRHNRLLHMLAIFKYVCMVAAFVILFGHLRASPINLCFKLQFKKKEKIVPNSKMSIFF